MSLPDPITRTHPIAPRPSHAGTPSPGPERPSAVPAAGMARVLVCENLPGTDSPTVTAVRALGFHAWSCATLADALRETSVTTVDLVIAVLPGADDGRFSMLQLLRRAQPTLPVMLISEDGSLGMRARIQPMRPYYFAVPPVREDELREAIEGALLRRPTRD